MTEINQPTQEEIHARLAIISKAVEEKMLKRQQVAPGEGTVRQEQNVLAACPVDPMERLLCENCQ